MDFLKKFSNREAVVETGEEKLHEVYDFNQTPGKVSRILVGVDGGSTQTRVAVTDIDNLDGLMDDLKNYFIIPSLSSTVPFSNKIDKKSPKLYDDLESNIVNLDVDPSTIFRSVRLIRGGKYFNSELSDNRLGSSTQKTQDVTFYYNILDGIGYSVMMKYGNNIPEKVEVWMGVALPPDDLNPVNEAKFKNNLKKFKWTHASGISIEIEVKGVLVRTEPEAFIKSYYALSERDIPDVTLHIEGGGRSLGLAVMVNGEILDTTQETLDFGGTQLKNTISDFYVAKYGGSPLRPSSLEDAVRTGFIRNGNRKINVSDIVDAAKKQFADRIFIEAKQKVFDKQTRVSMRDLNTISVSGRFFNSTKMFNTENDLPLNIETTIANYLGAKFKDATPDTEFLHIEGNYIPSGLLVEVYLEFVDVEDVSKSTSDAVVDLQEEISLGESEVATTNEE